MTLANWFTPRRRRAETSRRRAAEAVSTASQPIKAPEPRRPPESRLRAPRGREVWCVATGPDDATWHETKAEAMQRVDSLAGKGVRPIAWPVEVQP